MLIRTHLCFCYRIHGPIRSGVPFRGSPMLIRFPMLAFLSGALAVPGSFAAERDRPSGLRRERRIGIVFRKLDRDGDGRLSFGEWYRNQLGVDAMPSKALGFFRASDLNRNRRLSAYEFGRSQGIRVPRPNSNLKPGVPGGSTQGATLSAGSSGGSNTTSGLAGGSSVTRGGARREQPSESGVRAKVAAAR